MREESSSDEDAEEPKVPEFRVYYSRDKTGKPAGIALYEPLSQRAAHHKGPKVPSTIVTDRGHDKIR